jgi:hypothetical protein
MKSIYQEAFSVLIWLGDYEEPRDEMIRSLISQWGLKDLKYCNQTMVDKVSRMIRSLGLTHQGARGILRVGNQEYSLQLAIAQAKAFFESSDI